jgi:prenyltransferase beta subunit
MKPACKRSASYLVAVIALATAVGAAPLPREQRAASIAYANGLQNPDGGFRPTAAPGKSQLGSVPSAIRIVKYFRGELKNRDGALKFVMDCYHPSSGGFSNEPGGAPDVRSTAMGVMVLGELKTPLPDGGRQILAYFDQNAKSLPERYIAAAALHGVGLKPAGASEWIAAYEATRNGSHTYGNGGMDTARAVNTVVRLGGPVRQREAVVRDLKSLQRPDGGFAAMGGASDLGTTYPVMRALHLLKERPDVAGVRRFVATCRNSDGGYGVRPGEPSTGSATYFAAIVLHWVEEMEG